MGCTCGGYGVEPYRKSGRIRNTLIRTMKVIFFRLMCICVPCSGTSRGYCFCVSTPYILISLVMVAQGTEALTHHVN